MASDSETTVMDLIRNIHEDLIQNENFEEKYENHNSSFVRSVAYMLWTFREPGALEEYTKAALERSDQERKKIIQILRKYKWPVPESMPMRILSQLAKLSQQRGNHRANVNKAIIGYYSQENFDGLARLVEGWSPNPLFRRRMKIIMDCVKVLQNPSRDFNPSNVILPTLISQIEGVLNDILRKLKVSRKNNKNWKADFRLITEVGMYSEISELANHILLDLLFQRAYSEQSLEIPFAFSRHKILHGEIIGYGRFENTLRAFLILDFLNSVSTESTND